VADATFALTEGWLRQQSCDHHDTPVPAETCLGAELCNQAYDLGAL
jgi:hypothetical protein